MSKKLKYAKIIFWPAIALSIILLITSALYVKDDFDGMSTKGIVSTVFAVISLFALMFDDVFMNLTESTKNRTFRIGEYIFFGGHLLAILSFAINLNELHDTDHIALWITNIVSFSVLAGLITAGYVLFEWKVRIQKDKA